MKRTLPGGGTSQRRVRHPVASPTDPNVTHGNAAIYRREYANLVAGDRKKKANPQCSCRSAAAAVQLPQCAVGVGG
jgi:hypothetical protein